MKIDRTLFLALAVALTGVACAEEPPALDPSSADDSLGADAPSLPETELPRPVATQRASRASSPERGRTRDATGPAAPAQPAPQPADDGYVPFGDGFHDFGKGFESFHPSSEGSSLYSHPAEDTAHRLELTLVSVHSAVTARSS